MPATRSLSCLSLGFALMLFALLTACGGGGGGGEAETPADTSLAAAVAPASFDFSTSEAVTLTLTATEHGLTGPLLYVKVALDADYGNQLYLGRLASDGSVNITLSVPGDATTLYYRVYGPGEVYDNSLPIDG